MSITRDDVLHVAELARLELTEPEVEHLTRDLGSILSYVEELAEVDTSGVPPTAYVAVESAPLRADEVEPSLENERVIAEAPRHSEGAFAVPAFVEES